jgi:hypothetical protein
MSKSNATKGGFLPSKLFSFGIRRRNDKHSSSSILTESYAIDNDKTLSSESYAFTSVTSIPMEQCGRSQSEGRFRLPSMPRFTRLRRASVQNKVNTSAVVQPSQTNCGTEQISPTPQSAALITPPTTPSTGAVMEAHSMLTMPLIDIPSVNPSVPETTEETATKADTTTSFSTRRRSKPIPIAVPSSHVSSRHTTYSPRFSNRYESDTFMDNFPLRHGPSGYAWPAPNSGRGQPTTPISPMAPLPKTSHVSLDTTIPENYWDSYEDHVDHEDSDYIESTAMSRTATDGILIERGRHNLADFDYTSDLATSFASPDILGTSPPGVHAWRRRRSLATATGSTFLSPLEASLSQGSPDQFVAPRSREPMQTGHNPSAIDSLDNRREASIHRARLSKLAVSDIAYATDEPHQVSAGRSNRIDDYMSTESMFNTIPVQQTEPRLELWEARRKLRAFGNLDAVLAQPNIATVRCTLTPALCRDALSDHPTLLEEEQEHSVIVHSDDLSTLSRMPTNKSSKWSLSTSFTRYLRRNSISNVDDHSAANPTRTRPRRMSLPTRKSKRMYSLPSMHFSSLSTSSLKALNNQPTFQHECAVPPSISIRSRSATHC